MTTATDSRRQASSAVARVRSTPRALRPRLARRSAPRAGGAGMTLDDLMLEVVEDLALRERARCPVCAGELIAFGPDDGRCRDCGSALS